MGLYLINDPEALGSIRSARPYFVTVALEYDAVYVRAGGSKQAKEDVRKLKMADIDSMSSSSKVFGVIRVRGCPTTFIPIWRL